MNPKKMKVSELRAALELRGLSSNGLKTELIQRLELALDEEEFGSEAQEMEELKVPSPRKTKKTELKKKDFPTGAALAQESSKNTKLDSQIPAKNMEPSTEKPATTPVENEAKKENMAVVAAVASVSEKMQTEMDRTRERTSGSGVDISTLLTTEKEKRAIRAAKFGIPLSLDDKKAQRAKRFHLPSAVADEENGKRLKRAERFQLETKDTLEKKKEARAERFGLKAEEKRRLERAKRFGLETSELLEEKRQKRMERFATASN